MDHFHGNSHELCYFCRQKPVNLNNNNSLIAIFYNKLLTNLHVPSLSCTGEYWPSVLFVRTSGLYSPVLPSCSVSKRLLQSMDLKYLGLTVQDESLL